MRLNVTYATGDIYARHAGVSMISLFENNKDFEEIFVYIIDDGIKDINKDLLKNIADKYNRKIQFIKFEELCDVNIFNNVGNYSKIIFSKMYLHNIKGIDKILYIDCDMIITQSLKKLWELDMNENLVGGVRMPTPIQYRKVFSSGNNDKYINGGLILFNLKEWREIQVESKILDFIEKYKSYEFIEENIICNISKEKILLLDAEYNLNGTMIFYTSDQIKKICDETSFYNQKQLDYAKENPIIIHYSSEIYERPWYKKCDHPYKSEYLKYLSMSQWDGKLDDNVYKFPNSIKKFIRNIIPFKIYFIIRKFMHL